MKKLTDTNRITGRYLVDDPGAKYKLKEVMVPFPQPPAIVVISPPPQVSLPARFQTPEQVRAETAKWETEFPKLGTPAQKPAQKPPRKPFSQRSSAWPDLPAANSASRAPVRGQPLPARPTQPSSKPQVKIPFVQQAESGKPIAPRFSDPRKARKPPSVTDENQAPAGLFPSPPLASAANMRPPHERSPTPGTTISSAPSHGSDVRSPSPSETTPGSSLAPNSPPTRYASRPGSPVSFPFVQRPEFDPGSRDRPAGVRFPGGLPSDATRSVAFSTSHVAFQDSLEMLGNLSRPSSPVATPLVRRPAEPLALIRHIARSGLQIPSIPERSSSKRPPVPPKPQKLRMKPSGLSNVLQAFPESQALVNFTPTTGEPKLASPILHGETTGNKRTELVENTKPSPLEKPLTAGDDDYPFVWIIDNQPIVPCYDTMLRPPEALPTDTVTANPREQVPDGGQNLFVQAAMEFLYQEIRTSGSTRLSKVAEAPPLKDPADDYIQESQVTVSESETREFYTIMNQQSARPADLDKEKSQAKAESKARHMARKNDLWGLVTFQHVQGHGHVARSILSEPSAGILERSSSRHSSKKRTKSEDCAKTVFHMLEPMLGAVRAFPGRLTFEVQLGMVLIPPTKAYGPMDLKELRKYFNQTTGLPSPKPFLCNRLAINDDDLDNLVDLHADGRRVFDQDPFEETIDYEFHCVVSTRGGVESFLVTIFNDEAAKTTGHNFPLGNIHLNFPDYIWDAAIVLTGQSPYVKIDEKTKEGISEMVKSFRKIFSGEDITIETTVPPPPFEVKQILMKRISKYRYLRPSKGGEREDLYMRIAEIQDLIISYSGFENTDLKASCPPESQKVARPHRWTEVSLISSGTEEALGSNWKLEVGSQTSKWNTATLFGQGSAPASSSASSSPDALVDAPGLWSLFGLTEIVVKNMNMIGFRGEKTATVTQGNESKVLVVSANLSKPQAVPLGQAASGRPSEDQNKSLACAGNSRLQEHEDDPRESRYW